MGETTNFIVILFQMGKGLIVNETAAIDFNNIYVNAIRKKMSSILLNEMQLELLLSNNFVQKWNKPYVNKN